MNAWVKAMSGINELKLFGGDDCLTENAEWRNMPKNDGKYRMYEEERKKREKTDMASACVQKSAVKAGKCNCSSEK